MFDDEAPPNDWWSKWVLGTTVPVLLAVHALRCMVVGRAWLPSSQRFARRGLELHGGDAVTFGVAVLALALLMHVHYLWNNSDRLAAYVNPGKHVSLLALVGAVVVLVWRVLFMG